MVENEYIFFVIIFYLQSGFVAIKVKIHSQLKIQI